MIEIFPMRADNERCQKHLPKLLSRIIAFAKFYEPEEDAKSLVGRYLESFNTGVPTYIALVMTKDGTLVGHALLVVEERYGVRWLNVQQYEIDRLVGHDRRQIQAWVDKVKEVAGKLNIKTIKASVRDGARARAFERYGFKQDYIIIKIEVT